MKRVHKTITLCLVLAMICCTTITAQITKDPGAYMAKIGEADEQVSKDMLSYVSAVAHGKSARKVEKKRGELMTAYVQSQAKIKNMPPFEGDTTYRAAAYNYLKLSYTVLKEDYGKIVNMEEIAEQSYDKMEAYITMQDMAQQKLHEAFDTMHQAQLAFASKHNIKLLADNSELSRKSDEANKVQQYYHSVYLIFFKSYRQESYMAEAVSKKDVNGVEQNKNSLIKSTAEGLDKLKAIKAFAGGDASLTTICKKVLEFYSAEANKKIGAVTDFYLKNENFEKLKKTLDSKKGSARTQADVDQYNAAAKDFNAAVVDYNKLNKELYDNRSKLLDEWNNAVDNFLDKHTPKYDK